MGKAGRTRADDTLAIAIAAGKTYAEAATAAGVSITTVSNRLNNPEFAARVAEIRSEMVKTAAGRLADGMSAAADVLRKLLTSDAEGIRLRASVALLEQAVKVAELFNLQQRVADLERQQQGAKSQ